MFERRYLNAVIPINSKDAAMISGMEGDEEIELIENDQISARLLKTPRTYIMAIWKSLELSKMGISPFKH